MAGVKIFFLGGVGEIGGNKILVDYDGECIILDFGVSYARKRMYYSEPFLSPRSEEGLLEFGLLPEIKGIYRFEEGQPTVSAVFLSHAHLDHAAYISFLKREIPVYCGETAKLILEALNEIRGRSLEHDFSGLRFETFRTGFKVRVGCFEVEPVHVDHSIPGAYGFIVYTPDGALAYTGDFRLHGGKPELSWDFIRRATEAEPEALIIEGTNLTEGEVYSEHRLMEDLRSLVSKVKGLVLADFAATDIDRFRSFLMVAEESGRRLAIDFKHARLVEILSSDRKLKLPSLSDERLAVYRKAKRRYAPWEKTLMDKYETVSAEELARKPGETILALSFYSFGELLGIRPPPGSCYILSSSEPVGEEAEVDYWRMLNWLEHYGLPKYHIHVSGHIMPLQLLEAVEHINPSRVFPIHCERPTLFQKFLGGKFGVQLPVFGEAYSLKS